MPAWGSKTRWNYLIRECNLVRVDTGSHDGIFAQAEPYDRGQQGAERPMQRSTWAPSEAERRRAPALSKGMMLSRSFGAKCARGPATRWGCPRTSACPSSWVGARPGAPVNLIMSLWGLTIPSASNLVVLQVLVVQRQFLMQFLHLAVSFILSFIHLYIHTYPGAWLWPELNENLIGQNSRRIKDRRIFNPSVTYQKLFHWFFRGFFHNLNFSQSP